jgi:protein-tyrosine phosphatase
MQFEDANPADEIVPGIWLGSHKAALSTHWLSEHRIACIFNCTKDIAFQPSTPKKFRVPVDDNLKEEEIRNMELWSYEIVYKLLQEYKIGQPILVHCAAGMQRSAACVAMLLTVLKNMKPNEAIDYIRVKRPIAFRPAVNFEKAIYGFYTSYQNKHNAEYMK